MLNVYASRLCSAEGKIKPKLAMPLIKGVFSFVLLGVNS